MRANVLNINSYIVLLIVLYVLLLICKLSQLYFLLFLFTNLLFLKKTFLEIDRFDLEGRLFKDVLAT